MLLRLSIFYFLDQIEFIKDNSFPLMIAWLSQDGSASF